MTLIVDRAGSRLRIGRGSFELWPAQGRNGTRLCEALNQAAFSTIARVRVAEFPVDLELEINPGRTGYRHLWYLSIIRTDDGSVRFIFFCDYLFREWTGLVNLKEFVKCLVGLLNELPWLQADVLDCDDEGLGFEAHADCEITGRLTDHFQRVVSTLIAAHAQVLDRLSGSVRAAVSSLSAMDLRTRRRVKPRAFICHDSRDKSKVARPIAERLAALMCPVWYDEFSLQVGDRLRESIEAGLQRAGKCILIVSPRFLRNNGWSKTEFDSIFSRELIERKDLLLPVWVGVTPQQVLSYSPALANRLGVSWSRGLDEVVRQLYSAAKRRASRERRPIRR